MTRALVLPPRPWSAPSAGVYGSDGLLVCTLGAVEVTAAYRKRGDRVGRMMTDAANLIAEAPAMRYALEMIVDLCDPRTDCISEEYRIQCIREIAQEHIDASVGPLSPSERGVKFEVPR